MQDHVLSTVRVDISSMWWEPFWLEAKSTERLQRFFFISDPEQFKRYVTIVLLKNNGRHFFLRSNQTDEVLGATAAFIRYGKLEFLYYWASAKNMPSDGVVRRLLYTALTHFATTEFSTIRFPSPSIKQWIWDAHGTRTKDAMGRNIVWYDMAETDFLALFGLGVAG